MLVEGCKYTVLQNVSEKTEREMIICKKRSRLMDYIKGNKRNRRLRRFETIDRRM
jgi:hypothetical protein